MGGMGRQGGMLWKGGIGGRERWREERDGKEEGGRDGKEEMVRRGKEDWEGKGREEMERKGG